MTAKGRILCRSLSNNFMMLLTVFLFLGICDLYADDQVYLKHYSGTEKVPDSLYSVYEKMVAVFRDGRTATIRPFILPESIRIDETIRPKAREGYGGMNLYFLKTGFDPMILNVMKLGKDVFLLRTGTTYMRFVNTNHVGWKLYSYGDKPIE